MPFPTTDEYWMQARSFLEKYADPLAPILAPNEFLEFFPGTYHYNVSYLLPAEQFQFVVVHKGMATEIEAPVALKVLEQFHPVFANEVFVIYAQTLFPGAQPPDKGHIEALVRQFDEYWEESPLPSPKPTYAAVITTYNRPQSLARSLPQVLALGIPVVVVDDGSSPENDRENQRITEQHQVPLIRIPENRGLPNAMNVGLEYWLADPQIDWISYFQDDVDIHPETLKVLEQIQDPHDRPLLAGRDALEHPNFGTGNIAGYPVLYKRSMPGQHLHAHRDYWRSVMPIPTPYLGAPKPDRGKPGQGADEDWWITCWSPHSITKRGGYIVCVPGLVRSFRTAADESTWGNLSELAVESRTVDAPVPITPAAAIIPDTIPAQSADQIQATQTQATPIREAEPQPAPRAIAVPADLSLAGINVLVDGYNLQLTKGTGIKTYGISLIQALTLLGAHIDVLLSRSGYKSNAILDEVLFFDNQVENRSLLFLLKGLVKTASPLYRARRRKADRNFVVKRGQATEDFLKYAASFNLPQCYSTANVLYKKLGLKTQIAVPEKVDLWHATYPLPMQIRGAKKITTIHDLIPLRLPYATLDDKENFYFNVRDAIKESSAIITVSENSQQDLLTYFEEADPDKIIVTYQPIALEPLDASRREVSEFLDRYGLENQKFFLFVGAIEPKKNVGRLIDAYASLDTDFPLVIVGKKGWLWEDELAKLGYVADSKNPSKQVKLLEYVSANSLRYLYRGAFCLVFPSLYEGFGLPPVEAMSFGCPVITSNVSCLPEVCGDAALYVDPYEVSDIKDKMEALLGSPALRSQLSNASQQVAEHFSMENYLRRIHTAYRQALK
ncbi:MAG TPA: glycosyltransferase [Coleofasciculaceae cyanobacterium]